MLATDTWTSAPKARLMSMAIALSTTGVASATTYQITLTRQRPMRRNRPTTPDFPSVTIKMSSAARNGPNGATGICNKPSS